MRTLNYVFLAGTISSSAAFVVTGNPLFVASMLVMAVATLITLVAIVLEDPNKKALDQPRQQPDNSQPRKQQPADADAGETQDKTWPPDLNPQSGETWPPDLQENRRADWPPSLR